MVQQTAYLKYLLYPEVMDLYKFIRNSIFCQADAKKKIEALSKNYSDIIAEHVMKCVVFGKSHPDYVHWIEDEICTYINTVGRRRNKSNIKPYVFEDTMFYSIGDEPYDAKMFMLDWLDENSKKDRPYPRFVITSELCTKICKCYSELAEKVSNWLAKHKHDGRESYKDEILSIVKPIIDKYSNT
jgi:hypothetical protein